ncbi:MAG: hypothetical protein Q9M37_00275 [Desulfonauticus sp.]|nr:hypothetical protein [Desulfonauticus sp.]
MLESHIFYLLIIIAVFTSLIFIRGSKKNKKLSKIISKELEESINPKITEYINIGGLIGYHANYELEDCFYKIKCTFTLLPRHTLVYFPVSLILSKYDRLYVVIFSKNELKGEAHLIRKNIANSPHHKIKNTSLQKETYKISNIVFFIYYQNESAKEFIKKCIQGLDMNYILHISAYPKNKNFYLYMKAVPGNIAVNLKKFFGIAKTHCSSKS